MRYILATHLTMITIIIPTYNEQGFIEATLRNIAGLSGEVDELETIVSDGGSTDDTIGIARRLVPVVNAPRGRAAQLNAAAARARGDILFFVHADMRVPGGALRLIDQKVSREGYGGGGFSNVFSKHNRRIKTLGRVFNLRMRDNDHAGNSLFFGDNGIFVRRSVFDALGGFSPLPIMEDYEFSIRMRERFRVVRIQNPKLVVSPRRHIKSGFVRTRVQWVCIKRLYQIGVSPRLLARWYNDAR